MREREVFPSFLRTESDPGGSVLEGPPREVVVHHQPKTAGSTFRQILESFFQRSEICPAEIDDEIDALTPQKRRRYRFFGGHFRYDTICRHFPDALWLTMMRNPIDRVISNFYNLRNPARYTQAWIERAEERPEVKRFLKRVQKMTLEEFVFSDEPRARDRVVNRQTRYLVPRMQSVRACPLDNERLLEQARRNLRERFVFVGVQEHFEISLQLLLMTFGLPPIERPERFYTNINKDEKSPRGYELSDCVRQELERLNQLDLALWRDAGAIMFDRYSSFLSRLIEQDCVLRREVGLKRLPVFSRTEMTKVPAMHVLKTAIKRRMPQPVKRFIKAHLRLRMAPAQADEVSVGLQRGVDLAESLEEVASERVNDVDEDDCGRRVGSPAAHQASGVRHDALENGGGKLLEQAMMEAQQELGRSQEAEAAEPAWRSRLEAYRSGGFGQIKGWVDMSVFPVLESLQEAHDAWEIHGSTVEIGVHHGLFFLALDCLRRKREVAAGIDVFDAQELNIDESGRGCRELFERNLHKFSHDPGSIVIYAGDSLVLGAASLLELLGGQRTRLFSVDGGHTSTHAVNDLRLVSQVTVNGGAVIVDDYFNPNWPGVTVGVVRVLTLDTPVLVPVLIVGNKLVMTTASYRERMLGWLADRTAAMVERWRFWTGASAGSCSVKRVDLAGWEVISLTLRR